jgi:outer membrane receptor protein involved in Fe transport
MSPLGQTADLTSGQIDVIGITPLESTGTPISQIPSNVQILKSDQIKQQKPSNMADLLNDNLGTVSVSNGVGNPYQNDVNYRGFQATSVLGAPVGLSVYFDGVRFNESLSSSVNWDLIPMNAVSGINLMPGSNPLFGLNTLGGALAINTKNGKDYPGGSITFLGGSFGRGALNAEYGGEDVFHNLDYFVSINKDYQDGWRDHSKSDIQQLFGKLRWHSLDSKNNLEVSIALADNTLSGTQALPMSMLSNPKQAYTWPDTIGNRMVMVNIKASSWISDTKYLAANAYFRKQDTNFLNSNAQYDDGCTNQGMGSSGSCYNQAPNGTANDAGTASAHDWDGKINTSNVYGKIHQDTFGTNINASFFDKLFGHENALTFGAVADHSDISLNQDTQMARLINYQSISTPDLKYNGVIGGGSHAKFDYNGLIRNVNLKSTTEDFSLFLTNNFQITEKINATASGSYNIAFIDQKGKNSQFINDDGGGTWKETTTEGYYNPGYNPAYSGSVNGFNSWTGYTNNGDGTYTKSGVTYTSGPQTSSLDGRHHYARFNPAVGLNFNPNKNLGFFGGYSESMRAPTSIELSCADKNNPCNLPTGFNGDPDLKEVVAKTWETGARGKFNLLDAKLNWNTAVYDSYNFNDIQFISATANTGYFQNVGKTRRIGFELGLNTKLDKLFLAASYGYVNATFRSSFNVNAQANSSADVNDQIQVNKGNKIPGIADQTMKLRAAYDITPSWNFGSNIMLASAQYAHGDENNQDVNGKVPGYGIMNLDTRYQFNSNWTIFGLVNNVFDKAYASYGLVGTNIYSNSYEQFRTPATERAGWLGITYSFGGAKKGSLDKD